MLAYHKTDWCEHIIEEIDERILLKTRTLTGVL